MDQQRMQFVTRSLRGMPSRRDLLRSLAGAGLGLGVAPRSGIGAEKKRKRKIVLNAFGCVNVGGFCESAAQCCSGICQGRKGKRRCQAHDTGNCPAGEDVEVCGGADVTCTTSLGHPGRCGTTTGNAGYCFTTGEGFCRTDRDCQVLAGDLFGPTAACIRCNGAPGGTACVTADKLEIK
jgi:hypothetical protein